MIPSIYSNVDAKMKSSISTQHQKNLSFKYFMFGINFLSAFKFFNKKDTIHKFLACNLIFVLSLILCCRFFELNLRVYSSVFKFQL
jgi:hypothetical protein